jgi:hypothetical protein
MTKRRPSDAPITRLNVEQAAPLKTVFDNRGGPRRPRPAIDHGGNKTPRANSAVTRSPNAGPTTITVRVPIATQQRGVRKLIITPHGGPAWVPNQIRLDDTLIKALARAHRWNRMLESGDYTSMTELAEAENVTESYLCRILRLTLLSPKIVEAALDGVLNAAPLLQQLLRPFPVEWREQEAALDRIGGAAHA